MDSAQNRTQAIALLGRRDEPADGVQDYCEHLARGMARQGWALEIVRVPWPQLGWRTALRWLAREARAWRGRWVLVQYTALSWSRRGFPLRLVGVLRILRRRGVRCAVIFHDTPYPGDRWIDRMRRWLQMRVMRMAYRQSEHSVVTFDLAKASWLPASHGKAAFIPVGANVLSRDELEREGIAPTQHLPGGPAPSLAVFGLSTWPTGQQREVKAIVHAAREAASRLGELRLVVMGHGSQEAAAMLRERLAGSRVALTICGILSGREIGTQLMACEAFLFIRRGFSTRRGSGLAAIACGVPMVAYEGEETGFPLAEGGIAFVPEDDLAALADEVTRVLSDSQLRASMRARNEALYKMWFSWDRIAERLISLLSSRK